MNDTPQLANKIIGDQASHITYVRGKGCVCRVSIGTRERLARYHIFIVSTYGGTGAYSPVFSVAGALRAQLLRARALTACTQGVRVLEFTGGRWCGRAG